MMPIRPLLLSVALAIGTSAALAQEQAITYKGLSLGVSQAEYKSKFPHQDCLNSTCYYTWDMCFAARYNGGVIAPSAVTTACRASYTFGGMSPRTVTASFHEDKLVEIRFAFPTSNFDTLSAALTERLGSPDSARDFTTQNRMGAKFPNREEIWNRPTFVLRITRTPDSGFATLADPADLARHAAEVEKRKSAGAKDF